jgi:hypothetical protein
MSADAKRLRYIYKFGFVVADDVVRKALSGDTATSLTGSWVIRLKKPVPCVFVSIGFGGVMLPNTGLCVVSSGFNGVTKEERMALHRLMVLFDPDFSLKLHSQWVLVDLDETQGTVVRRPTSHEVATLRSSLSELKSTNKTLYKTVARVDRRRTTSGGDMVDGHEDDSDRDPMHVMLDDLSEKERRAEKARLGRLGNFPDTTLGWQISRLMRKATGSRKRALERLDSEAGTAPDSSGATQQKKQCLKTSKTTESLTCDDEDLFGERPTSGETDCALSSRIVKQRRPTPQQQGPLSQPRDTRPIAPASSPLAVDPSSEEEEEEDPDYDAEEVDYCDDVAPVAAIGADAESD